MCRFDSQRTASASSAGGILGMGSAQTVRYFPGSSVTTCLLRNFLPEKRNRTSVPTPGAPVLSRGNSTIPAARSLGFLPGAIRTILMDPAPMSTPVMIFDPNKPMDHQSMQNANFKVKMQTEDSS